MWIPLLLYPYIKKYFSLCRTDSASADQDNLKYSSSRDRGSSASYGLQPSNSAVVSRQRHDDIRVHTDIQNEEKGTQIAVSCVIVRGRAGKGRKLKWWRKSCFVLFCFVFPPSRKGSELICLIATVSVFGRFVRDQRNVVVVVNNEKNVQLC